MNKSSIWTLSVVLASALTALPSWAQSLPNAPNGAHYANNAEEPECTPSASGLSVTCSETAISGVGNTNARVSLLAEWEATVQCENKGGNIVEVKSRDFSEDSSRNLTRLRNGTLYVSAVTVSAPSDGDFLAQADCPNGNWTPRLAEGSPTLVSYTYTLTFVGFTEPAIRITYP